MIEVCAELSANHNGSLKRALDIVDAAARAGADLFKIQTWKPGTMCLDPSYKVKGGPWQGRSLTDLYEEAWTPWGWHKPIFDRARERGMIPFSAAFDIESVDFLEELGVDRHKVASFEITDLHLIRYMANTGKPILLSTGMATEAEIAVAMGICKDVTPLKCTSSYPAEAKDANLATMAGWERWGLSDHSLGIGVAVAAAALGACYIEKHLTLDRKLGGLDAGFSLEPDEFTQMVQACHQAAEAYGERKYGGESQALRRSLWVAKDIPKGTELDLGYTIRTARPALGLPCATNLRGMRASRDLKAGTPLTEDCIDSA